MPYHKHSRHGVFFDKEIMMSDQSVGTESEIPEPVLEKKHSQSRSSATDNSITVRQVIYPKPTNIVNNKKEEKGRPQ